MDTSESEHSDNDLMDDEWVQSEKEATDDEWVMSGKRQRKKINLKNKARSSTGDIHDPENSKSDCSGEAATAVPVCCACSKYSLCKTSKCQCRASGGCCGISCGCMPNKCSNRVATTIPDSELGSNETENNQVLASHGAMLLESALVEKPRETSDDSVVGRKPLSDIGNTMVCSFRSNQLVILFFANSLMQIGFPLLFFFYRYYLLIRISCRPNPMHQTQTRERNGANQ